MWASIRSLPLVVLAATLTAAGCSSVTDFDRFHDGEDAGSARDSSMDSGRDGGDTDGGPCTDPVPEECNDADDDCDGMVDEDFDLDADPANCGSCGRSCPDVPNSGPGCEAGECVPECDDDWADCNGDYIDGCETDLTSPDTCTDCGTVCDLGTFCSSTGCVSDCPGTEEVCGRSCVDTTSDPARCGDCTTVCETLPHSSPTCESGTCGFACDVGWSDCNGDPADGCETDITTVNDCGDCDVVCSYPNGMPACNAGTCELDMCNSGFEDCNTDDSDGCESDLGATATCGDCTTTCAEPDRATGICDATGCDYVCDTGWDDCNGLASDGCEADLSTATTCGDCSTSCSGGTPVCSSGACVSGCSGSTPTLCSGSCVNTNTNPLHCGACDDPCPEPTRSTATCSSGTCGFSCDGGWGDCDSGVAGCETSLTTVTDCGSCGSPCTIANGTPTCSTGTCAISDCDTGWADCSGGATDGCETDITTTTNCGGCGTVCSVANGTAGCSSSACVVAACNPGFGDCNDDYSDGCETSLTTFYRDADGDGYGVSTSTMRDCTLPAGYATVAGDCNDSNVNVNPAETEVCNTIDDNCDGTINEGFDCNPGQTQTCTMTVSGCSYAGTQACNSASCSWGSCMPPSEVCNASDEDCDGYVDENQLAGSSAIELFTEGTSPSGPRIAYSRDLEQFGVVFTMLDGAGTRELWIATADLSGSLLDATRIDSGGGFYQPDITWIGSAWAVPYLADSMEPPLVVVISSDLTVRAAERAEAREAVVYPPRVAPSVALDDTFAVVWREHDETVTNETRAVTYDFDAVQGQLVLDSSGLAAAEPAVVETERGWAAVWGGQSTSSTDVTFFHAFDVTSRIGSRVVVNSGGGLKTNHEAAWAADTGEVVITWNQGGTPYWQVIDAETGSDRSGGPSALSGTRAQPGWAGDRSYAVAFGSGTAPGTFRRFRQGDETVVPGDVALMARQTLFDMASVREGSPRHALVFTAGDAVWLKLIECLP